MLILISGATKALKRWRQPWIGQLVVPASGRGPSVLDGRPWALDNSAFSNFDAAAFVAMVGRFSHVPGCRFCAAPDVVGDAEATAAAFPKWAPMIRAAGLPVALVGQDGLTVSSLSGVSRLSWRDFDALFIGGSTEWKLGADARALVAEANRRGKWTHMGRVNTVRRLRYAEAIGCCSVDGTGFSRFPDAMLQRARGWAEQPAFSFA